MSDESIAKSAVLVQSEKMDENSVEVVGPDFNVFDERRKNGGSPVTVAELMKFYGQIGFQATNLGEAIDIINEMRLWRDPNPPEGKKDRATIFLGYTSNLISSGVREILRYLVQHKCVDVLVTTAGGIEEDFIKCLAPTYLGDFALSGEKLRKKGINRIGNLVVPNENYCLFEEWILPIMDKMVEEQEAGYHWSPSRFIHRLGKEINDERSVYYWAYKNNIPVFSPALTDGSIGDMLYFHTFKADPRPIDLDIVPDIRAINSLAVHANRSGMIILGGGVIKHHICNANLMRNGADWTVYINTANEFDGSDAGARPDEAVSWGKIRLDGRRTKVYGEVTIIFPLIVAATFAS
ncbi:eIF-5A-deoxyhypusine synthase [Schizosaccharomyces japonicus yFS275]|uniref:deoxyhypusine synthase n=1 Tax=Schizosaccharomyces japonicus (strain yFS275 / FY16936) TaxID=402676 RepID=B6K605_SCHJY|nr:eIF-5A-deoxyhypusine synthase [Schizosaccharomyces japonicus yFS275]EEB08959.1 eIF-5A-deoxyhypusine synthase [Schizosaccharomyces japonicus yFS275]